MAYPSTDIPPERWRVDKGNPASERDHLNRILQSIGALVAELEGGGSGGFSYITSDGEPYASDDLSDLYIGE
jgi:hypothetical protein